VVAGGTGTLLLQPGTVFSAAANSTVGVGIIGTGDRGQYVGGHMGEMDGREWRHLRHLRRPDRAGQEEGARAADAKVYKDYRRLLDDKNVDAVYIATPVYLHRRCSKRQSRPRNTSIAKSRLARTWQA